MPTDHSHSPARDAASGGRPPAISVVIVARNEAGNLPRCLDSVKGWTAETIVVLNDTTDDSAAIAAKFGARVVSLPWQGFRDTKNAALELAAQPWALCLDADEEVSPALRGEIAAFLSRPDLERFCGARFPRKVWFIDRWITHGDWYPDFKVRLCRRGHARWDGDSFVHERIVCDGPVATLRGDLYHYSFPTLASQVAKINPFADLYLRQQLEKGRRFSLGAAVFRPVWRFFRAYVLRLGFLDGFPGLYIAWSNAFSTLVRQSRLYEAERRTDAPCPTNRNNSASLPKS
jgi:glycosyltransferase involved in cell wall biosynthesis